MNKASTLIASLTFAQIFSRYSVKKLYYALMIYAAVVTTIATVIEGFYGNFSYAIGLTWWLGIVIGWVICFGLSILYGIPMFAFLIVLYHVCEVLDPAPAASKS